MNNPPTAVVGFASGEGSPCCRRLSMNNPPTALVGFRNSVFRAAVRCRLSMNESTNGVGGIKDDIARRRL